MNFSINNYYIIRILYELVFFGFWLITWFEEVSNARSKILLGTNLWILLSFNFFMFIQALFTKINNQYIIKTLKIVNNRLINTQIIIPLSSSNIIQLMTHE